MDDLLTPLSTQEITENANLEKELEEEVKEDLKEKTTLEEVVDGIKKRVRNNWDFVFTIDGEEGSGKSVLNIELGRACDDRFTLQRNIIFSPDTEDMKKKILDLPKYAYIGQDEVMKILDRQRWAGESAQFLRTLFSLIRKKNKINGMCIPNFMHLNSYFRDHRTRMWIHVVDRGTAVCFMKDWNPFEADKWRIEECKKYLRAMMRKRMYSYDTKSKIKLFSRLPIYVTHFNFPDLDKETKEEYEKLVIENDVIDRPDKSTKLIERKWKIQRERVILDYVERGLKASEIAKILDCSTPLILHEMAKAKINQINLKNVTYGLQDQ